MTLRLLEQEIPGLTDRVQHLSAVDRERLARAAVELAVQVRPVDDPRAVTALAALRAGSECSGAELRQLIGELEDRSAEYYAAWDEARAEEPGSGRERALGDAHEEAFNRARAMASLDAALTGNVADLDVIGNVLYEAGAALGYEPSAIDALVAAVEDGLADPVKQAERRLTRPA